ncbi:MAG: hypothetical protein WCJ56_11675 [bacterium]
MSETSKSDVGLKMPRWYKRVSDICENFGLPLILIGVIILAVLVSAMAYRFTCFFPLPYIANFLSFSLIVGYLALAVVNLRSFYTGWIGLVTAIVLKFTAPLLLSMLVLWSEVGVNDPLFRSTLIAINEVVFYYSVISILQLLFIFNVVIIQKRSIAREVRMKYGKEEEKKESPRHVSPIPRCWEMTRCRVAVRNSCPNYIDRKTCWKRRRGCFCDKALAAFLVNNMDNQHDSAEVIALQTAMTGTDARAELKQAQQANNARVQVTAAELNKMRERMRANRLPWRSMKRWCHECPLFMEHQEYKYHNFNWIGLPITALIVFFSYTYYDQGYRIATTALENAVTQATASMPSVARTTFNEGNSLANSTGFEWFFLGVLSVILLSYVVTLTDTMLLKWKM